MNQGLPPATMGSPERFGSRRGKEPSQSCESLACPHWSSRDGQRGLKVPFGPAAPSFGSIRRTGELQRLSMKRRTLLVVAFLAAPAMAPAFHRLARPAAPGETTPFVIVEQDIPALRAAMEAGRVSSRAVVLQYLTRIAVYEDKLNAAITVNP